jgi:hypothetical protein
VGSYAGWLAKKFTGFDPLFFFEGRVLIILRCMVWPKKYLNPQTGLKIYGFSQFAVSSRVALTFHQ